MSDKKATEQKDNVTVQTDLAAEAAKILEEAEAKADSSELVTIQLFKDSEKYKDDKFVAVNGKTWQIKRGVPVQVPKYVADVLEQSMKQDTATANMIERENAEFERKAEQLGV